MRIKLICQEKDYNDESYCLWQETVDRLENEDAESFTDHAIEAIGRLQRFLEKK